MDIPFLTTVTINTVQVIFTEFFAAGNRCPGILIIMESCKCVVVAAAAATTVAVIVNITVTGRILAFLIPQ